MKELQIFNYELNEIRTVIIDGEPWWVGKDVCLILGYKDVINAMKQHCKGVAKYHPIIDNLGRTQEVRIINEPNLFRLIVSSKLDKAQKFENWIFEEVLPQIRKTGEFKIAYTNARGKSKKVRNAFTSTLQNHGCDKFYHYINITKSMKVNLSIDKSKKKDAYDIIELAKTTASESVATVNMLQHNADGYQECKTISDNASMMIEQATRREIA